MATFHDRTSFLKNAKVNDFYLDINELPRMPKSMADDTYTIESKYDKRPDLLAHKLYGSANFDWVVLIASGILNVRNEWPLSNRDLYNYANDKYGESLNSTRFFETKEVKDSSGRLILPKGKVVDSNFTIPKPDTPTATLNPVVGISNFEYETRLNDKKRNIFVIREEYLQQFLDDMREIMTYNESSEFIDGQTIQTQNTNVTLP